MTSCARHHHRAGAARWICVAASSRYLLPSDSPARAPHVLDVATVKGTVCIPIANAKDTVRAMAETNIMEQFKGKFRLDELLILRNSSWSWSVRPWQPTLGSGVLSLNRFAPRLSDATPDEMRDLAEMISAIEGRVRTVFNYHIMNYFMLMMVDHHVHFHVIPRYASPRTFGGLTWVDNGWPGGAVMSDSQHEGNDAVLCEMQAALKAA